MFFLNHAYRNGLAYLLWRWLLKNNGKFVSSLDSYFFGPSRGFNDYNKLAQEYKESNIKPDKQYSILPTVLSMAGDCREKRIIDMGCGNGFFTVPLADKGAEMVWGIDNSQKQINFARRRVPLPNVKYVCADVFVDQLPQIDLVIAPFVANYARTASILKHFFKQIYSSLSTKGKLVLVIDLPNGKSLKRFGASKEFLDKATDEEMIQIDLYNIEKKICTLHSVYYRPQTVERLLGEVGFRKITWHKPIVSEVGIQSFGKDFWDGYGEDPELGYLTAEK